MRRCQRLPELTHPVDSARPTTVTSNPVPAESQEIRESAARCRPVPVTRLTSTPDARAQPFAELLRLSPEPARAAGDQPSAAPPATAFELREGAADASLESGRLDGGHRGGSRHRGGAGAGGPRSEQSAARGESGPRVVESSGPGSWIGVSVRDVGDDDVAKMKLPARERRARRRGDAREPGRDGRAEGRRRHRRVRRRAGAGARASSRGSCRRRRRPQGAGVGHARRPARRRSASSRRRRRRRPLLRRPGRVARHRRELVCAPPAPPRRPPPPAGRPRRPHRPRRPRCAASSTSTSCRAAAAHAWA